MTAKFVGKEGAPSGVELALADNDEWIVGRDPDACDFLVDDPAASDKHLLCRSTPEGFSLELVSDEHPAEVNGTPLEGSVLLEEGDTIRIGDALFLFTNGEESEPEESNEEEATVNEETLTDEEMEQESVLEEEAQSTEEKEIAEVDLDLTGSSRWLLKVVAGPNTGAEFPMEPGQQYTIGTDPASCDVIFHDLSVSRHHARLKLSSGDSLTIEDLDSRNGVMLDGEPVEQETSLEPNKLVTIGTTAFMICDREDEAITIASPFLIPTETATEEESSEEEGAVAEEKAAPAPSAEDLKEERAQKMVSSASSGFLVLGVFVLILATIGFGISTLFQQEDVFVEKVNHQAVLEEILGPYPEISFTYEKNSGRLLLIGHVLTGTDREQIMYELSAHKWIRQIDDNVVVNEYLWQENNLIIGKNPDWQGVTMQSPSAGKFTLTGYLKTQQQYDTLMTFINVNFPYPALLSREVIVEQQLLEQVTNRLLEAGLTNVTPEVVNGDVVLSGTMGVTQGERLNQLIRAFRDIPGVRAVRSFVIGVAQDTSIVDLTDQYFVSGYSNQGDVAINVVINGRILARGDLLDGMTVTSIQPGTVILERDGTKYKIDFNK